MHIQVNADGHVIELPQGATGRDLATQLHLTSPEQAIGLLINGSLKDLSHPLQEGDTVKFLSFGDKEGKEIFWHTSAHVLAQAVLRLFPQAKPTIGPSIEQGFYYDFAHLEITEVDLARIEEEVEKILKENHPTKRHLFKNRQEALSRFHTNPYKLELIEGFDEGPITAYEQGEFFDLCRGPHLPVLGKIKAFKILKTSGAYWKGDPSREMLTRIYGISFPDRKLLKEYLTLIEEAKKRDHKILGPRLDLFSFREEAPGIPFIHPKGMVVWNRLLDFLRSLLISSGYVEIKTPHLMGQDLWERSGHWHYYRDNMYTFEIEDRAFAIKPMNCPGCMLFYKTKLHSYRELPLRVAEIGLVHRHEASGALNGLFRVRSFHQDDAHLFLKRDEIKSEIIGILHLVEKIYSTFGLSYRLELSTRPAKSIGTDDDWEIATSGLQDALDDWGAEYRVNEGDGAFYGPKIDIHIRDAIGRSWQCGTVQLDMALPEKFDLEYTGMDGRQHRPIMLHRAIFGSIERFFGILVEHFAGRLPLWISPRQVRLLTVADRHHGRATEIVREIERRGLLCELDDTQESVGKKIRTAQLLQANYMVTIGDKEIESGKLSVRTREGKVVDDVSLEAFLDVLEVEVRDKVLHSVL
jgi:threonyl-tRNA synthetase